MALCIPFHNFIIHIVQQVVYLPSHPVETNELGTTASSNILGDSPFKSREARHPSKPWRACTNFGSLEKLSFGKPPVININWPLCYCSLQFAHNIYYIFT